MMKNACLSKTLLLGAWCMLAASPLTATTIFDNSVHSIHANLGFGGMECGDEIQLAGTARLLTNFSCGYVLVVADPTPHVTVKVRFYLNDGPPPWWDTYPTPGTVIYDSGWLPVGQALPGSLVLSAGSGLPADGLFLPSSDMTWSIQFQGLVDDQDAPSLRVFSPPVVGSDPPYSWLNQGDGYWDRQALDGRTMDFMASFEATEIPEPSSAAFLLLTITFMSIVRVREHEVRRGANKGATGKCGIRALFHT